MTHSSSSAGLVWEWNVYYIPFTNRNLSRRTNKHHQSLILPIVALCRVPICPTGLKAITYEIFGQSNCTSTVFTIIKARQALLKRVDQHCSGGLALLQDYSRTTKHLGASLPLIWQTNWIPIIRHSVNQPELVWWFTRLHFINSYCSSSSMVFELHSHIVSGWGEHLWNKSKLASAFSLRESWW